MLKSRVAIDAAIQISKYKEGLSKMHKINYLKNLLADSDRVTAALDRVKPISTNYLKNLLADSDRVTAALDRVKPISTNYLKNLLADSDRAAAALDKAKPLRSNYLKNLLADSDRVTAALDKAKPLRSNCIETCYNRDLAYRGEEETNHAIEDYNETVKLNLELEEKDIFGDGLAFAATEKEAPNNITFNIQQLIQKGGTATKVEITNSTVGLLNTGEMLGESITANISTLADFNQYQIAEALKNLTEVVKASQDISSQQRTEILEQLNLLSEQAILAPSERKAGLIKPILSTLATALSAGGGLAEIWSKWGNVIEGFFGIHG